jgi:hypothetical protein
MAPPRVRRLHRFGVLGSPATRRRGVAEAATRVLTDEMVKLGLV